ncbi:MAG: hypothetical protein WCS51_01085 [Bacilli bacterium]|jgi:hypothetical protein
MEPYKKYRDNYIELESTLKQKEEEYFVLFYWTICPHCLAIVSDVTRYLDGKEKVKLYLLDYTKEKDSYLLKNTEMYRGESQKEFIERYCLDSVGAKDLKDVNYYYVPMLLHIKNGEVFKSIVLENNIAEYLRNYED